MFSHITTTNPFLLNIPNNTTVHLTTSKTRMLCTSVYQLPSRVLPIISLYKCSHHDQRGTAKNSPVERTACKNIARRETTHNRKHVEQQSTTSTEDHRLRFRVLESLKTLKSSCACQGTVRFRYPRLEPCIYVWAIIAKAAVISELTSSHQKR